MKQLAYILAAIGSAFLARHIWVGVIQDNPHHSPTTAIAFFLLAIAVNAFAPKQ